MEIDDIIMRVLTNSSSQEDVLELSKWLNADEEHRKEFEQIKSYWNLKTASEITISAESSFDKLMMKINQTEKKQKSRRSFAFYYGIAASLVILLAVGAVLKMYFSDRSIKQYTYATSASKSTFFLNDKTKVILNKNSELTYTSEYGSGERKVMLNGEAYFEVTKNKKSPFIVAMNGASVKVLGTTFNVQNRKSDKSITVTLVEGSVRFISREQNVLMRPQQKLQFNKGNNSIKVFDVNPDTEIAWKDGLFKYRTLPFYKLMERLEDDYGVKIVIQNPKLMNPEIKMSGGFEEDKPFDEILKIIGTTQPIKWEKNDSAYIIY